MLVMLPERSCLLPIEAAHWQEKRWRDVNTKPNVSALCQVRPLERSKCRIQNRCGLMLWHERGVTWILRLTWVSGGCRGLFHSSFLAGTRVRAMMMGTRATQLMARAHRGR